MAEPWTWIPKGVLADSERQDQADTWAGQQRKVLAQTWADQQRSWLQGLIQQAGQTMPDVLRSGAAGPLGTAIGERLRAPGAPAELGPEPTSAPIQVPIPQIERPEPEGWQPIAGQAMAAGGPLAQALAPTLVQGIESYGGPVGALNAGLRTLGAGITGQSEERQLAERAGYKQLKGEPITPEEEQALANQALMVGGMSSPLKGNTPEEIRKGLQGLGQGMGRSIREADLRGAEQRMAKLRQEHPEVTDEMAVKSPLGQQIEKLRQELQGEATPPPSAAPKPTAPPPPGAPPTVPPAPGAPEAGAEVAGNIRLGKYVDPEVQKVIQETVQADPNWAEQARRGVVTDAEVRDLAEMAGSTTDKVVQRWQPGKAENAETILALRETLAAKAKSVTTAQAAVKTTDSTENLLRLQLAVREYQAVQETVHGVTAEAGRALRQFRQEVKGAWGDSARMRQLLQKMGGADWTEQLAQRLGQLDMDDPTAVGRFIRSAYQPRFKDYVTELWYNSILSGPTTHLVNFVSNGVSAVAGPVERVGAAVVEAPLAKLQGRPRERFFGEARADIYGMLTGIPEGARGALYVLKNGFNLEEAVRMDIRHQQAFKGPVGEVINLPSRALAAADVFWRSMMFRGAEQAEAFRLAKGNPQKIAELLTNPTPDLLERAGKVAKYRVFQADPGNFTQKLMQMRNAEVWGMEPVRFVIPFVQTPVNLTKFGLERSPLGWFNPKLWANVVKRDPAASDQIARAFMGSTIAAGIGALVGTGQMDITGDAPTTPAERDRWYREGKQPFSFRVGDRWYSYQKMEPFNQTFAQMAAFVDAARGAKQGAPLTDLAGQATMTIAKNLVSQSYMEGLSNLLDAVTDYKRYGGSYVRQTAASFVPGSSLLRTAARATDTTVRQPSTVPEQVAAGMPVLSRTVPPKVSALGQEQRRESPWWSPVQTSPAHQSRIDRELARHSLEVGLVGNSVRGRPLNPTQKRQYQRLAGSRVVEELGQVVGDPSYQGASVAEQQKMLQTAIRKGKDSAADEMAGILPEPAGAMR